MRERTKELDRINGLLAALATFLSPEERACAVEIGLIYSPSAAFNRASASPADITTRLALGKVARWIAVLRRDYGEDVAMSAARDMLNGMSPPVGWRKT